MEHTELGAHSVFIGQVRAIAFCRRDLPLLYVDRKYARLIPISHAEPLPEGAEAWSVR